MVNTPPTGTDPTATTVATTAAITDQTQALTDLTTATTAQNVAYHDMNTVSDLVQTGMDGIEQAATDAGVSLTNLTTLTQRQSEQFTVFSSAAVNARVAFSGFSNVDYSGLTTFTDQIKVLKEALENTPLTQTVAAVNLFAKGLVGAGASQSSVNAAIAKGVPAVLALANNMAIHADNMARAQTAYVQMSARTGELGDVMKQAGAGLRDMNVEIEKQQMMLQDTREATGLTAAQTEKWYSQLGSIPGALKATVSMGDKAGASTSMLTAVIQTATGSGRDMTDVMKDLSTAFRDYGLVGEKALLFSVRMSDVSTRLKAPIEDVTGALRGSADAFKMFATGQENAASSAESLANTLNKYGKALESTGLSATAAVEVAGQLNTQVAKLNTGQLAFISQQTGGAGGLQGAAQETLKLQKDPGAVVEDAMKTLQQQFGKIVTVQEAATSQSAASMNIKQTTMLQTLLGPLAKDQASANRLLEAMKNQSEGQKDAIISATDALKPTGVADAAQKGADMQAKTYGVTTKIMNLVEQIRDLGDRGSSNMAGKLTAGATNQELTTFQGKIKASFADTMQNAKLAGGPQARSTALGLQGGMTDTGNADAAANIHQALGSLKDIPTFLRASFDTIAGAFRSGDKEGITTQQAMLKEMIESRKQMVKQLEGNPEKQAEAMSEMTSAQALLDATNVSSPSGRRVGVAAQHSVSYKAPGTAASHTPGTGAAPAHVPGAANANALHIIGKITIDCPHCGKAHDASSQFKSYTGPAGQSQQ